MSASSGEELSQLYRIIRWIEDPYSDVGRRRFEESLERLGEVVRHQWFQKLISRKRLRLLEICGGTGIGGVALARVLRDEGCEVELFIKDVREDALKIAERWGMETLGEGVETRKIDAREIHEVGIKPDVVLMYGFSAPHFDAWNMVRLLASVAETLRDDGLFIMEEVDRRYIIFYLRGYMNIVPEVVEEESIALTIHAGYDMLKGTFRRAALDLLRGGKAIVSNFYYWGIAELMALSWLFFQDIDFILDPKGRMRGFILANRPRRRLRPIDFSESPRTIKANDK